MRSRGLNLRGIYDAIAQLRRRGIVPPAPRRMKRRPATVPARFARVEVRPAVMSSSSSQSLLRLRVTLANGRRAELEFEELEQLPRILAALEAAA